MVAANVQQLLSGIFHYIEHGNKNDKQSLKIALNHRLKLNTHTCTLTHIRTRQTANDYEYDD